MLAWASLRAWRCAKVGSLLAACVLSWVASTAGSAGADCAQTVHELRLELVELEAVGGNPDDPDQQNTLEEERAVIAEGATIVGDFKKSEGIESIEWRTERGRTYLERVGGP